MTPQSFSTTKSNKLSTRRAPLFSKMEGSWNGCLSFSQVRLKSMCQQQMKTLFWTHSRRTGVWWASLRSWSREDSLHTQRGPWHKWRCLSWPTRRSRWFLNNSKTFKRQWGGSKTSWSGKATPCWTTKFKDTKLKWVHYWRKPNLTVWNCSN